MQDSRDVDYCHRCRMALCHCVCHTKRPGYKPEGIPMRKFIKCTYPDNVPDPENDEVIYSNLDTPVLNVCRHALSESLSKSNRDCILSVISAGDEFKTQYYRNGKNFGAEMPPKLGFHL